MPSKEKPKKSDRKKIKEKPAKKRIAISDPDYWFSLCVRQRAGWSCESCGKHYAPWISAKNELANPALHCSHYIGRANYATRFDPLNVDAHCYFCHTTFEGNPHEFRIWKLQRLGQELYDIVIEKSKNVMLGKQARKEKALISEHYKQQFYLMKAGKKDFQGYF